MFVLIIPYIYSHSHYNFGSTRNPYHHFRFPAPHGCCFHYYYDYNPLRVVQYHITSWALAVVTGLTDYFTYSFCINMKVLKFGGTSVANEKNIERVMDVIRKSA